MSRPWVALLALLMATASMSLPLDAVTAAEITHTTLAEAGELRDVELILISGDLAAGDEEKFRRLSIVYDQAVVALDSEGGALLPAIEIGKLIRIKEYPTVVTKDSVCTSACALIWVAGSTRFLSPGGNVGFHASYTDIGGEKQETGLGNALVGRYLTLLNLPEKAIIFATLASPDEVLWLTQSNMRDAGIDFEPFDDAPVTPPIVRTTVSPSSTGQARANIGEGLLLIAEVETRKHYIDRDTITKSGRYRSAWSVVDHSKDLSVDYYFSGDLWYFDCTAKETAIKAFVTMDSEGNALREAEADNEELKWNKIVPGSVGEKQFELVCGKG